MRFVYIDPCENGFAVRVLSGASGDKTTTFSNYKEAASFAAKKMGKTGCVVDATGCKQ